MLVPAFFLAAVVRLVSPACAQDIATVVKKMDELYRADSSYAEIEMEIVTPHWQRTLSMKSWTEGKKKTFIQLLSPPKEKGVATLRLGSEMWNYLPRANKVIKIPPSMMMSSWMGSDFTNDDLVKAFTLLDDYRYEFITPEDIAQPAGAAHPAGAAQDLLYIALTPREGLPVVWGKIVAAVTRDEYLPVWDRYYDEKGALMRIINFRDVKLFGGRRIPSVMEVIPQDKKDQRTVLRYVRAEFNISIPEDVFSLRNLRTKD
jgi:outer membrane lipoprotein-sorting protein